tara:strand:- start:732 stop:938 length:207 start_codon:yes stop_codon:yes gene_type:complete
MSDLKEIQTLVGCYRRCLLNDDGEKILKDLRKFSLIDEQAGSELNLQQMSYRNALQDMYRYIEAMLSE